MSHYRISSFKIANEKKNSNKPNWSIRGNIFISGKHTSLIAKEIEDESWGAHHHQLYHYFDYTFRVRVMEHEINVYTFSDESQIVLFHTGLISKKTGKSLYLLAKPNKHAKRNPAWAVPNVSEMDSNIHEWFTTKESIMKQYGIKANDLPKEIEYTADPTRLLFNPNYICHFDWEKIFADILSGKAKKTIIKTIKGNNCKIETKQIKQLLSQPFRDAIKRTLNDYKKTGKGYVYPGLFIDFDKREYWVDLMMYIQVKFDKRYHTFVVVIRKKRNRPEYKFLDLLSLKQGYYNGRYIQKLPSFWKPKTKGQRDAHFNRNNNYGNNNYNNNNNSGNYYREGYNSNASVSNSSLPPMMPGISPGEESLSLPETLSSVPSTSIGLSSVGTPISLLNNSSNISADTNISFDAKSISSSDSTFNLSLGRAPLIKNNNNTFNDIVIPSKVSNNNNNNNNNNNSSTRIPKNVNTIMNGNNNIVGNIINNTPNNSINNPLNFVQVSYEQYYYDTTTKQTGKIQVSAILNRSTHMCTELRTYYPSNQITTRTYYLNVTPPTTPPPTVPQNNNINNSFNSSFIPATFNNNFASSSVQNNIL